MTSPGLHQRIGFAIGTQLGRALRAVHFQRNPLQMVPTVGPWFLTYAHQHGLDTTGVRVNLSPADTNISGGLKGHPGLLVGVRWRRPRGTDWSWSRTWPDPQRGTSPS